MNRMKSHPQKIQVKNKLKFINITIAFFHYASIEENWLTSDSSNFRLEIGQRWIVGKGFLVILDIHLCNLKFKQLPDSLNSNLYNSSQIFVCSKKYKLSNFHCSENKVQILNQKKFPKS